MTVRADPEGGPSVAISPDDAWRDGLVRASVQALRDLAACDGAEMVFVRAPKREVEAAYLDAVSAAALADDVAVARVALTDGRAFDTLDRLVAALLHAVVFPGASNREHGFVAALAHFAKRHGAGALARFDQQCLALHAYGDLVALARSYLDAPRRGAHAEARITAWIDGTELARADEAPIALGALSARTARRAIAEFTRLVRVLGARGTLVLIERGETLAKLPAGRRDDAYTVVRELVDNADGGRGLIATRIVVTGGPKLFTGTHSLASLRPLAMRIDDAAFDLTHLPPPHRPTFDLRAPRGWLRAHAPAVHPVASSLAPALRSLLRGAQGLPPVDAIADMSVGHERIDAQISSLFEHSAMDGSVFALLVGAYGSGKTHLLTHLAARALADKRPVLRLSLERLDVDLGNPQRHLLRVLEQATLPVAGHPSALERLVAWTRSPGQLQRLRDVLERVVVAKGDAASAARKALAVGRNARVPAAAFENFLAGRDLVAKDSGASYRRDAYGRLLLWFTLLEALDGCAGPVVIVDEAENLYRGGATKAERRTALRSLSFYCGGTLPRACVVVAITPDALTGLRGESGALLADVAAQKTVLAWEDALMLDRRLSRLQPVEVPPLASDMAITLAFRVRAMHAGVRGEVDDRGWPVFVETLAHDGVSPREVVRRCVDRLESAWWHASR